MSFLFVPICPYFSGIRDGYRLAFDARSKAFTRDSGVHARLADARQVDSATYSGGSQIPPGGKGHEERFPPPSLSAGSGGSKGDNRRNARRRARCAASGPSRDRDGTARNQDFCAQRVSIFFLF